MKRTSILAHRGLFLNESEKNSPDALNRAIDEGFGIETDLRDFDGNIIISHDPPRSSRMPISFEGLLKQINSSPNMGRIALNIKSDGLSAMIESLIASHSLDPNRFFVFDMSIPDSLSYLKGSIPAYSRISEYEQSAPFPQQSKGVWVDNFNGHFPQVQWATDLVEKGIRAAVVSSELHQRDHSDLWNKIFETGLYLNPLFELCTDFPIEAAKRFCNS